MDTYFCNSYIKVNYLNFAVNNVINAKLKSENLICSAVNDCAFEFQVVFFIVKRSIGKIIILNIFTLLCPSRGATRPMMEDKSDPPPSPASP